MDALGDEAQLWCHITGCEQWFHNQCYDAWASRCRDAGQTASCPCCRGATLVHSVEIAAHSVEIAVTHITPTQPPLATNLNSVFNATATAPTPRAQRIRPASMREKPGSLWWLNNQLRSCTAPQHPCQVKSKKRYPAVKLTDPRRTSSLITAIRITVCEWALHVGSLELDAGGMMGRTSRRGTIIHFCG